MQRSATLAFWGILAFGLYSLGSALQPLLISFAIAYLVFPLVKRLEKRGIRRQAAVLSVLVGTTLFWIIVGLLVVPGVLQEGREFLQQLPQNAHRSIEKIEALASSLGFEQSINKETIQAYLATHMTELSGSLAQRISQGLQGLFTNLLSGFLFFLNLMLVPIFFFYVINDYEKILAKFESFVPPAFIPRLEAYVVHLDRILGGYLLGQSSVALILAGLYGLGFTLVGVKFGLVIGLMTGFLSFIPYVGPITGFGAAMIVTLANYDGLGQLFGIIGVFAVIQGLEGFIITPRLVGNKVGLNDFSVILALIAGGNLLGFVGILIAIPCAAFLKILMADLKTAMLSQSPTLKSN